MTWQHPDFYAVQYDIQKLWFHSTIFTSEITFPVISFSASLYVFSRVGSARGFSDTKQQ